MSLSVDFVRHARARRYLIRVRPDGSVRVTLPRWGSRRHAERFVEQQQSWIERQRRKAEQHRDATVEHTPEQIADFRRRAAAELPDHLRRIAASHGLTVAKVSVRNQRWRWGSCSPAGHICLNWRLVLMPDFVRDYVLVHELMHLKRLDHSRAFWTMVADACPGYESARAWLRDSKHLLPVR
ncbi:MAG: DUF45 domain-containing protein [Acidobacteria bacterium]|nr:DUF45 domain-containing protein [Acidobacteriota bacterium]